MKDKDWADMKLETETEQLIKQVDDIVCETCHDLGDGPLQDRLFQASVILRQVEKSIRKAQYIYYGKGFENGRGDGYDVAKRDMKDGIL